MAKKGEKIEMRYDNPVIYLSKGNIKIGKGVYSFSTLPGNENNLINYHGEPLKISGTCSKHCATCFKGCYAKRSCRNPQPLQTYINNTILLKRDYLEAFKEIDRQITESPKIELFRWNVSGEIQSYNELVEKMMNKIAKKHPDIIFWVYTKNYEELDKFMQLEKKTVDNFTINLSQWHHCADAMAKKYEGKINVFEYDDSNKKKNELSMEDIDRLSKVKHCPAVDSNGKSTGVQCKQCGRCFKKHCTVTAVYAH